MYDDDGNPYDYGFDEPDQRHHYRLVGPDCGECEGCDDEDGCVLRSTGSATITLQRDWFTDEDDNTDWRPNWILSVPGASWDKLPSETAAMTLYGSWLEGQSDWTNDAEEDEYDRMAANEQKWEHRMLYGCDY